MRKFIFWPIVLLLTLFIGGLTFIYLNSSFSGQVQQQIAEANTQTVIVAAKEIPLRRSIVESDLTIQDVSLDVLPEGAATSMDQVVGMMATSNIFSGETILTQQLAVAGAIIQQIALTIPDNKVLVPIPIQSQLLSVGLVRPGDRVDLFGTFVAEEVLNATLEEANINLLLAENAAETIAVLRDLEVHAIIIEPSVAVNLDESSTDADENNDESDEESNDESDEESNAEPDQGGVFKTKQLGEQSILVALERQDSVVVKHLLDTEGLLDIALRSPNNTELAEVTNVDIFYLADRYGIELVRGNPVVMTAELFAADPGEFVFTGSEPSPEFLDAIGESQ